MATKVTEASLTCSICLRRYRKPRALTCLHSYCEECLVEYAPKGTQVLICPLCQEKIQIPDGDITKFKLDFRLQSQVEDAYRYEKEAGIVPEIRECNCCKDEGEAIAKCRTCRQMLCKVGVKAHESLLILGDHLVTTLMTDDDSDDDSNPIIVQVSNCEGISVELLQMYFENRRRSGGGEIVSLDQEHEGTVTMRFRNSEDAHRVLCKSHVLIGTNLTVLAGKMKKPRPKRPVDPTRIFLSGIAEGVNNELLGLYLENCTGKDETPDITYGEKPGTAMVTYTDAIEDLDSSLLKIQKKRLRGQLMSASHVYVTDCVLVTHLKPDTTQDHIELYFENELRSGGGPVREVHLNSEENQAIVYFEDYRVVNRVFKRKHIVYKAAVNVSKYYDCLGASKKEFKDPGQFAAAQAKVDASGAHRARSRGNYRRQHEPAPQTFSSSVTSATNSSGASYHTPEPTTPESHVTNSAPLSGGGYQPATANQGAIRKNTPGLSSGLSSYDVTTVSQDSAQQGSVMDVVSSFSNPDNTTVTPIHPSAKSYASAVPDTNQKLCRKCYTSTGLKCLEGCNHTFCRRCITSYVTPRSECLVCKALYSVVSGPLNSTMTYYTRTNLTVPKETSNGAIVINYSFPDGILQHGINRGRQYKGNSFTAYLPNNTEGLDVLWMLRTAFIRDKIFEVTMLFPFKVTWSGRISHKTSLTGGGPRDGYPDPEYLARVKKQLNACGIVQTA